ncbi:hypothetical protein D3C74_335480 [compost metagenome]
MEAASADIELKVLLNCDSFKPAFVCCALVSAAASFLSLDCNAEIAKSSDEVTSLSLIEISAAFCGSIFSKIAALLSLLITLSICSVSSVVRLLRIAAALLGLI